MHKAKTAITLIELIVAIVLFSIIILGLSNIDIFSSFHLTTSMRRAAIQNEASRLLDHMHKQISRAIGNELIDGANNVVMPPPTGNITGDKAVRTYIDANSNGQRESTPTDRWIAYRFLGTASGTMRYCPQCGNNPCTQCTPTNWGSALDIASNIYDFTVTRPVNAANQLNSNFVTVEVRACWNPATASASGNGTPDNPCVIMRNRIMLPSVSTN